MSQLRFESIEQLEQYICENNLIGLDPEKSKNMQDMMTSFSAKGLHLNKWWAITPFDWKCEACGRVKKDIARLNKHGYLTCHLHEHHDHADRILKREFEFFSKAQGVIVADENSEKFIKRAAYGLAAFDKTLICSDCNKADADAKKLSRTDDDFSFSPREIGRFIIVRSNQEHIVDVSIASAIWSDGKNVFEKRLRLIIDLARIAAENLHWYQPSKQTSTQVERMAIYHIRQYGISNLSSEPEKLLYNSVVFAGDKASWRRNKIYRPKKIPSDMDIKHLIGIRGKLWFKVNEDWICPCCQRGKIDCVYFSKNKSWVFEAKNIELYGVGVDETLRITLCNDCANAALQFGREAIEGKNLYPPSIVLKLEELKAIIVANPHGAHDYRNDVADIFVLTWHARAICILEAKNCIHQ